MFEELLSIHVRCLIISSWLALGQMSPVYRRKNLYEMQNSSVILSVFIQETRIWIYFLKCLRKCYIFCCFLSFCVNHVIIVCVTSVLYLVENLFYISNLFFQKFYLISLKLNRSWNLIRLKFRLCFEKFVCICVHMMKFVSTHTWALRHPPPRSWDHLWIACS